MPAVAKFIEEHEAEILRRWRDGASRAASARGLERPELTNIMPQYVSALARAGEDLGSFPPDRRRQIESHLATRIRQGYSVEEIVDELLLLGRCVRQLSDDEPRADGKVDGTDFERLSAELNRTAAAVSAMFRKHMEEDEQDEKRYARLLRGLARAALTHGAVPLRAKLDEALALIMEGVGANSAALLLYRPESNDLVSVATSGLDGMEAYVVGLAPSSLGERLAAGSDAAAFGDVATAQLEVPEALRKSGVHSLLGTRLAEHHTFVGILYVGLCEQRPFTPRETRRLEALGEQLTLHLDNAALFAALQEKVDALESEKVLRERFVSILAHDLRGPLSTAKMAASLLGMAQSRDRTDRDERSREHAKRIDRNLDRADRMIRDLLDVSRIHAGEPLPLHLAECDLVPVARETLAELSHLHGARFVLTGDERVVGAWAADELRRSLWNLAVNAVKYGASVTPITIHVARHHDRAKISVHNEGAPIPAEEQSCLFDAFARARSTQNAGPGGWGLGLALVRAAAEAHGGRVTVKSDAATGTTFVLELPLDARAHQPASPLRPETASATP
jgi:signal transduction histidine kinase